MNKIYNLLNFLIKNAFYEEAEFLFKFANDQSPEEYLQKNYPNIYEVSLKDFRDATVYINIINQLIKKGYSDEEINDLTIDNFEDLIAAMKGEKIDPKNTFLNRLKKKDEKIHESVTEELLDAIKSAGLIKKVDEFIKIYKWSEEKNTDIEETLNIFKKFRDQDQKNNLPLSETVKNFTKIESLGEIKKYVRFNQKWTAPQMQEFYKGIKEKALENSDIIYNSSKYTVIYSKSTEAAQWWEQSCVSYDKKTGNVTSGLCTASHSDNYFNRYSGPGIYILEIITKDEENPDPTPITTFKNNNLEWNLMSIKMIEKDNSIIMSRKGGESVNRNNQNISLCDLQIALNEEYEEIKQSIGKHFGKLIDFGECTNPKTGMLYFKLNSDLENINDIEDFKSLLEDKSYEFYYENKLYRLSLDLSEKVSLDNEFKNEIIEINHNKNKEMFEVRKKFLLKYYDVNSFNLNVIKANISELVDNFLGLKTTDEERKIEKQNLLNDLIVNTVDEIILSKEISFSYDLLNDNSLSNLMETNGARLKALFLKHINEITYKKISYTDIYFFEDRIAEFFDFFAAVRSNGQNSEEIITKYFLYQMPELYFENIDLFNKKYKVNEEEMKEAFTTYDSVFLNDSNFRESISKINSLKNLFVEDGYSYEIKSFLSYTKKAPVFEESLKDFGISLENVSARQITYALSEFNRTLIRSISTNKFIPNIFKDQEIDAILNFIKKYMSQSVIFNSSMKEILDEKILEYLKENNFFLKVDNSGSEKEFKLITKQELKSLKDKIKQEEKVDKYLSIYIYPLDNNILFINAPIFAPPFMILNYLEIPYYEIRPRRN